MTDTPPPALTASYEQILRGQLAEPWTGFSRADAAVLLDEIDRQRTALTNLSAELDTITAVARSNAECYRAAVEECERLRAEVAAARAAGMRDAAAMLRRHRPKHDALGDRADTAFMSCHCPGAAEIDRDADTLAARATTN